MENRPSQAEVEKAVGRTKSGINERVRNSHGLPEVATVSPLFSQETVSHVTCLLRGAIGNDSSTRVSILHLNDQVLMRIFLNLIFQCSIYLMVYVNDRANEYLNDWLIGWLAGWPAVQMAASLPSCPTRILLLSSLLMRLPIFYE